MSNMWLHRVAHPNTHNITMTNKWHHIQQPLMRSGCVCHGKPNHHIHIVGNDYMVAQKVCMRVLEWGGGIT